ncbi:MAG: hypothetical protein EP314_08790, partial [Bacteroidetes bacterium]
MMLKKYGLLGLLVLSLFIVPTGCREKPPKVDGVEFVTSPEQLGEWMQQLIAIIRATDLTGAESSRIMAYASIAYYQGYQLSAPEMRSLEGQLQGLDELPAPNAGLNYNYGIIAESAMTTVLLHLMEDVPQNIKLVIQSTYSDHERDYLLVGVADDVIDRSRAFGEILGNAINQWADADGYNSLVA